MKDRKETVYSVIEGEVPEERLLLVLVQQSGGRSSIELRQQSWSEGVQWYTQSSICLDPQQVAGLRSALGGASICCQQAADTLRSACRSSSARQTFRIVRTDSA
jgi:hypothetical protein